MIAARDVDRRDKAEAGGADLVERDAADLARQADGAAGLVLDPAHRQLVGAHVGAGDVVDEVGDRGGKGADQPLLVRGRHLGIGVDHRLAAAMRQARGGVLERHGAREPKGLLGAHVRRHADAADRPARRRCCRSRRPP